MSIWHLYLNDGYYVIFGSVGFFMGLNMASGRKTKLHVPFVYRKMPALALMTYLIIQILSQAKELVSAVLM